MRILFWNINRNEEINKYIANLVRDYNVDVLVTAEYVANRTDLHGDCSNERFAIIQRISHDIKELEEKTGLKKIIIIGDRRTFQVSCTR